MPVIDNPIREDRLTFTFAATAQASKYDDWAHYRNQFNNACGSANKAVDMVCVAADTAWLIEVKDYRIHARTKPSDLAKEVALKVRDTLAGLVSARLHANDAEEKRMADAWLRKRRLRVALHLETPRSLSRLHPKPIDRAHVLHKLKQLLGAVDPHPCVVDQRTIRPDMHWTVQG
ncbi:hypothetical protein GCM10027019_24270 [Melaminivora jejuensis]|uniref:hypothetical protein n=1 Tax=Melaminivora jejuensis TaxID=1267217 RepID=UPI001AE08E14|nr:hypothetical protein [Melaminivora jejuensis]UHJ65222.1 hypothetical protein LVC68_01450 [Melaminivora jejuensis]